MLLTPSYLSYAKLFPLTLPFLHYILKLKQGRPVQREAVLAGGAGDYSSMIYGDKEPVPQGTGVQPEVPIVPLQKEKVEKESVEISKAVALEPTAAASTAVTAAPTGE